MPDHIYGSVAWWMNTDPRTARRLSYFPVRLYHPKSCALMGGALTHTAGTRTGIVQREALFPILRLYMRRHSANAPSSGWVGGLSRMSGRLPRYALALRFRNRTFSSFRKFPELDLTGLVETFIHRATLLHSWFGVSGDVHPWLEFPALNCSGLVESCISVHSWFGVSGGVHPWLEFPELNCSGLPETFVRVYPWFGISGAELLRSQ